MSDIVHSDGAGNAIENSSAVLTSLQRAVTAVNDEVNTFDLAMATSENPETLRDDLDDTTPKALSHSHVTRTMTVLNYATSHRDDLSRTATVSILDGAATCAAVIATHGLHSCEMGGCNRAAFKTDLWAGWRGTGKEIDVCNDHYRGLDQDDMPVRESDYQTDPCDPDVEGVDEINAYQQDGMAGVAFVRQSREAWQQDMQ
jgi:hypothetical protein